MGHNVFETSQLSHKVPVSGAEPQVSSDQSIQINARGKIANEISQLWRRWSDKCSCRLLHIMGRVCVCYTLLCSARGLIQ